MTWELVSPGIWRVNYLGWTLTKILEKKDVYAVEHYKYIAVLGAAKFTDTTEIAIKKKIINSTQVKMF